MSIHSLSGRLWNRETVIAAIRAEARAGHELSYTCTEKRVPSLVRAAERVFGNWGSAVAAAGFDYEAIRRYRKWTRERVIARIQEWHAKGEDLSWRHVSLHLDPSLAAATLHAGRFASWSEALKAAGLNPQSIMRYRKWTLPRIHEELAVLESDGIPLDRMHLTERAAALLAAIYRIGGGLTVERRSLTRSRRNAEHSSRTVARWQRSADDENDQSERLLVTMS